MKKWMGILALALLLTGCTPEPPAPTQTTPPPSTNATVVPTEPTPAPEAIWAETLNREYVTALPMGENLLLIGEDILSLYSPNGVTATAAITLPALDSGNLQITETSIVCFDAETNALFTLGQDLKEDSRIVVKEAITGRPSISPDGKKLYYCTTAGVRVFDAETGISRSLKVQDGDWVGTLGTLQDGGSVICQLRQEDGTLRTMLLSTETGETLSEDSYIADLTGSGDFYCCLTKDEWIFGTWDQQPQNLFVENAIPLPQQQMAFTSAVSEAGLQLDLYDLSTGLRIAQGLFPEATVFQDLVFWQDRLVFLEGSQLWFWDWTLSPVEDDTLYTAYRYTAADPDTEGLAALKAQADALGKQYGIEILLWNDITAVQPEGYSFQVEHRTKIYEERLAVLEAALARFPEGFFKKAASWTEDGKIHIVLARSITTPADECGGQYLLGWNAYIPLALDEDLEQLFYHGLGHVVDTHILSHSKGFYEWDTVNPSGFQYDNNYSTWQDRDSKYLKGDSRYFAASLSMAFPVEDRATLLEYAMMDGQQEVFASKHMQTKLKRLKAGMREAFDLEDKDYPWEQYLK